MNVRPVRDRIMVRRLEEGEQQIGSIIIPDVKPAPRAPALPPSKSGKRVLIALAVLVAVVLGLPIMVIAGFALFEHVTGLG